MGKAGMQRWHQRDAAVAGIDWPPGWQRPERGGFLSAGVDQHRKLLSLASPAGPLRQDSCPFCLI